MGDHLVQAIFALTFLMAIGCSIAMIFSPNAVHVALFLVGAQIALAITFLLQGAQFLAIIQVIVYAGAIMVLFLFVIMLLGVDTREALRENIRFQRPLSIGLGILLAAALVYLGIKGVTFAGGAGGAAALDAINNAPGNVEGIARLLFSNYTLPFEATSILLVAAVVGVMVLARRISAAHQAEDEAREAVQRRSEEGEAA
jgi:NADH-quinone oxidoreductase subunit J